MSYEDNYDQTARWDAESVREAEQRTQHRSTRSSAERQKLKKKGQRRRFTLWLAFVLITSAILAGVGWLLANDMCSFNKAPVETTIEITRDDNLNTIATKLHDEGLIKYKWFFKVRQAPPRGKPHRHRHLRRRQRHGLRRAHQPHEQQERVAHGEYR